MKIHLLLERRYDADFWEVDGLGAAVGACFDDEQAREVVRARTLAFWRSAPRAALDRLAYFVDERGYDLDVVGESELFWLLLEQADDDERALFIVVEVVVVDVDALPRGRADRRDAVARLAQLLLPWSADAAWALTEDA